MHRSRGGRGGGASRRRQRFLPGLDSGQVSKQHVVHRDYDYEAARHFNTRRCIKHDKNLGRLNRSEIVTYSINTLKRALLYNIT